MLPKFGASGFELLASVFARRFDGFIRKVNF
jgi:hypothetical protein